MLPDCIHCLNDPSSSGLRKVVCSGFFRRASDGQRLQRFLCRGCRKTFSVATLHSCYRQRRRELNPLIFSLMASCVSQRRAAFILQINRKTLVRRFLFLALQSKFYFHLMNSERPTATDIQFDELETFEHSKCKPLSVTAAVEEGSRWILGFQVARMPAKGLLAAISRKKYGPRKDERPKKRDLLFESLKPHICEFATFKSDQHHSYPPLVRKHFPQAQHEAFKGRRGCIVGQGELKGGGFDPLFSLNHTFAMSRYNINRLVRRTWCTIKKPERLEAHFYIHALFHNLSLLKKPAAKRALPTL